MKRIALLLLGLTLLACGCASDSDKAQGQWDPYWKNSGGDSNQMKTWSKPSP